MARLKLLDKVAPEEGTYTVKFIFTDEVGALVTPTEINWWLSDLNGDIINSRSEVSATPANPYYLTMQGADLRLHQVESNEDFRVVTLKGTYNSDRGSSLPFTYAVMFKIKNFLIIAKPLYIEVIDHIFLGEFPVCSAPA